MQINFQHQFTKLPSKFYSNEKIQSMIEPKLLIFNEGLANSLSSNLEAKQIQKLISGLESVENIKPIAQKYCGHQFGVFNPHLGDGRGVLLGNLDGYEFHLKGSGPTRFARGGDGLATLSSCIREYIISEALHNLKVPSTRALALFTSKEKVFREKTHQRAIILRLAKTHIRFGHFEWLATEKDATNLKLLADFVLENYYSDLKIKSDNKYFELLKEIAVRTANMIANWQALGFCHGVMNTDNFSILGESFDFGPYAFIDRFDDTFICNSSDTEGRYAYNQQPMIGCWNIQLLAWAFSDLVKKNDKQALVDSYIKNFNEIYIDLMKKKLAFVDFDKENYVLNKKSNKVCSNLISDLLKILKDEGLDYTQFFLELKNRDKWNNFKSSKLKNWLEEYWKLIKSNSSFSENKWFEHLDNHNPMIVPRNHLTKLVVNAAEQGDYAPLNDLQKALSNPFEYQSDIPSSYYQPPKLEEEFIYSCSS